MDWQGRIVTTPDTLFGRPRIAGTRIGVDFVLDLLASGWSSQRILDEYPHLKPDDLQAVFAFVRDCLKDEDFVREAKVAEADASLPEVPPARATPCATCSSTRSRRPAWSACSSHRRPVSGRSR